MVDGHDIAMVLRHAYLSMHRRTDAALLPFGLTANQFVLLALLNECDGVPQRDLVQRASSDPNTIRPMLNSLQKKGFVERDQDPNDGRVSLVRITKKGRGAFKRARNGTEALRKRLCATLDNHERDLLVRMLGDVVDAVNESATQEVD